MTLIVLILNNLGVQIFKTASADIVDHQMHKFLSKTRKHVIISTGMATISEIDQVLKFTKIKKNIFYYTALLIIHVLTNQ